MTIRPLALLFVTVSSAFAPPSSPQPLPPPPPSATLPLHCLDETGHPIDMWFAVKGVNSTNYVYFDENNVELAQSAHTLNGTVAGLGALPSTLLQLWPDALLAPSRLEYLIFNDEHPDGTKPTCGHTKGIWAWDPSTKAGFILSHSIPKFPNGPGSDPAGYTGLPGTSLHYAQHLICLSLSLADMVAMAKPAQLTRASVYEARVSATTPIELQALANRTFDTSPNCLRTPIATIEGSVANLSYFAKSEQWADDLYAGCVAPMLGADLQVESWIRGSACGPNCSGVQRVNDVTNLSFASPDPSLTFKESLDHSKWGVDAAEDGGWVCACDINRMTTQYKRGGGGLCMQHKPLALALQQAIVSSDSCP